VALQHDRVSTFIHTPCATLPWIPPHSRCASSQSLSPSLLSTCSASATNPSRLVSSCLVSLPPSPRDILKTSLLIISRTSGWKECLAPGSHLQHCPSLLPLLVPFVVGPHGHAVTYSSRLGLLGYWLSLLYSLVLPYLVNLALNSLPHICCCSHTLITFEIFILFFLSSLFKFSLLFFDPFRPKNWWYTPLSTRFHRLQSLTRHSRSLNPIILSPYHSIPSHRIIDCAFLTWEHNGIQYITRTFHIPVDLESLTGPYCSQMYHVLANPNRFLSPKKTFVLAP